MSIALTAKADVVTEWNLVAVDIAAASNQPPVRSYRALAMTQSAVYDAVISVKKSNLDGRVELQPNTVAATSAAVASANRVMLSLLFPSQKSQIDNIYNSALSAMPNTLAKDSGIAIGEQAANSIFASRKSDGSDGQESYRPNAAPGIYTSTVLPVATNWPKRKPWVMSSANQFRPGPPPRLDSMEWARDYNEVKSIGAKDSKVRTSEQTEIALFWETSLPSAYYAIVRSVADVPGRSVEQNARLLATVAQALDDGLIAVFDAKYHYNFWRPITAIRNGDIDGNDGTAQDSSWLPLINTPLHPEYPCAHCVSAASVGAILKAETGAGIMPKLIAGSPSAPGIVRSWANVDDFVQEVANARIYDGVHYRISTKVGNAMGEKIGRLAAAKNLHKGK